MAVNFLVAFRVAEYAATPLRRISDATVRLSDNAAVLTSQARAANASLLAIGVAANAALGGMAVSASELENALARLSTATETNVGTVETALNNAEISARKFSENFSASAAEVIRAQFRLATAGVPVREQIDAVQGAFKLATATMGDFTVASELLGSFLNTFGKTTELNFLSPMEKVEKITDIASSAVQKYQLDLDNLNDSLKFLVGPASTLNLPVAEVFGFAGALNTAGFRGTLAGTAISNAFNKIDNAIEKLDLDPTKFTDATGNLKDFASFLDEVERATAGLTSIERQSKFIEVFDIRAGRAIGTLIGMKDSVRQFVAEADAATGVTDRLAQVIENTTSAQFKQLGNVFQNISTSIGKELNDSIKTVLPSVKALALTFSQFVSDNAGAISSIGGLVGITLAASAAAITYGLVVNQTSGALAKLATTSAVAGRAVATLRAVMAFTGIFAGLIGLAASIAFIVSAVSSIGDAFKENASTGERFISVILGIVAAFTALTIGGIAIKLLKTNVISLADSFKKNLLPSIISIGSVFATVGRYATVGLRGVILAVAAIAKAVLTASANTTSAFADLFSTVVRMSKRAAVDSAAAISGGFGRIARSAAQSGALLLEGPLVALGALWSSMSAKAVAAFNAIVIASKRGLASVSGFAKGVGKLGGAIGLFALSLALLEQQSDVNNIERSFTTNALAVATAATGALALVQIFRSIGDSIGFVRDRTTLLSKSFNMLKDLAIGGLRLIVTAVAGLQVALLGTAGALSALGVRIIASAASFLSTAIEGSFARLGTAIVALRTAAVTSMRFIVTAISGVQVALLAIPAAMSRVAIAIVASLSEIPAIASRATAAIIANRVAIQATALSVLKIGSLFGLAAVGVSLLADRSDEFGKGAERSFGTTIILLGTALAGSAALVQSFSKLGVNFTNISKGVSLVGTAISAMAVGSLAGLKQLGSFFVSLPGKIVSTTRALAHAATLRLDGPLLAVQSAIAGISAAVSRANVGFGAFAIGLTKVAGLVGLFALSLNELNSRADAFGPASERSFGTTAIIVATAVTAAGALIYSYKELGKLAGYISSNWSGVERTLSRVGGAFVILGSSGKAAALAIFSGFSALIGRLASVPGSIARIVSQFGSLAVPLTLLAGKLGVIAYLFGVVSESEAKLRDMRAMGVAADDAEQFKQSMISLAATTVALGVSVSALIQVVTLLSNAKKIGVIAARALAIATTTLAGALKVLATTVFMLVSPFITLAGVLMMIGAPFWLSATAAITAFAGVAWGVYAVFNAIFGSSEKVADSINKQADGLAVYERQVGSTASRLAKFYGELDRLGKVSTNKINFGLREDEQLGNLPFSIAATNMMRKDPQLERFKAIQKAAEEAGGVTGILTQLAEATDFSTGAMLDLALSLDSVLARTDATYSGLDAVSKSARLAGIAVKGSVMALSAMAGGSQQAAESLQILLDAQDRLAGAGQLKSSEYTAVFEAIDGQLNQLLKSNDEVVAKFANSFKAIKSSAFDSGEEFNAQNENFKKFITDSITGLNALKSAFDKKAAPGAAVVGFRDQIQQGVNQFKTATKAIETTFKNAELGGTNYVEAISKSEEKLGQSRQQLVDVIRVIEEAKSQLQELTLPGFEDTEEYKDLVKFIEDGQELEVELRANLNERELLVSSNRFFATLDQTSNVFLVNMRKNLAEALGSSVGDALTKKVAPATALTGIFDALKKDFVSQIQGDISLGIADQFKGEFQSGLNAVRELLRQENLAGTLLSGLSSGELQKKINERFAAAAPGLQKLGFGDILDLSGTNELKKRLFEIYDEASVKILTATNESATALTDLQRIVSRPATDAAQMQAQVDDLRRLLVDAYRNGADAAVGPIENALQMLMSQVREQGGNTPVDRFITGAQQAEISLTSVADRFAEVFNNASVQLGSSAAYIAAVMSGSGGGSQGMSRMVDVLREQLAQATAVNDDKRVGALSNMLGVVTTALREMTASVSTQAVTQLTAGGAQAGANLATSSAAVATNLTQAATNIGQTFSASAAEIATQIGNAGQSLQTALSAAATNFASAVRSLIPTANEFNAAIVSGIKDLIENIKQAKTTTTTEQQQATEKTVDVNINNQPQNINIQVQQSGGTGSRTVLEEYDVRKIVDAATAAMNNNVRDAIRALEERLRRR